jgi:hypothetical protein
VQALYVLGVVTACAAAGYSAVMVGLERRREELRLIRRTNGRPDVLFVRPSRDASSSLALERALDKVLSRRGRGDGPRHLN